MTLLERTYSRFRAVLGARLKAVHDEADAGQALVFALIVVLMIGLLPAIVLSSLNQEMPLASQAVSSEGALAAAEAGIQEYSNLMDQYTAYYDWVPQSGGAHPTGTDLGMPGGVNTALGGWQTVTPSNPPEYFTYYPDTSTLLEPKTVANPFGSEVLLVVTGRAGIGKTTQYRRIEAAFSVSGVITDVYFSNYEQPGNQDLDQWENTYQSSGGTCQPNGNNCSLITSNTTNSAHEYDEAIDFTPAAFTPAEPMATALCQYDATSVNTFIDWYSQNVSPITPLAGYPGTAPYSSTNQYYGPWYGSFPDLTNSAFQFGVAPSPGGMNNGDASACNTNYWITGDTFNGPVYSNDELTTCGTPLFTGNPALSTSVPQGFYFPATATAGWPGAQAPVLKSGAYVSYPWGYDDDPWGECNGVDKPTFSTDASSPHLGQSAQFPSADAALISQVESGTIQGCVYTGPTMIRFSYNTAASTEMMSVWSPLTQDTYSTGLADVNALPQPVNCGTTTATIGGEDLCAASPCTAANTQINSSNTVVAGNFAEVPITDQEVIIVQNATGPTDPNYWNLTCASALPSSNCVPYAEPVGPAGGTVAGCIDPWVNPDSGAAVSPQTCAEGDAIISGAVGAQVTISASNDVVLARSVAYGCAVNANLTYQTTLASCAGSSNVLGLIAQNDIWMARPVVLNVNPAKDTMAPVCGTSGTGADTDLAAASVTWSAMIPNCTVVNPVVDAAMASLTGFFEVEYWREGDASGGTINFNGSDAVNNSGEFGTFQGSSLQSGYLLTLNYDSRLVAEPPPDYLQATDGVWNVVGWVTCANTTPNPFTTGYPTSVVPTCTSLGNSYPP